jgi:hypothetical protein
LEILEILVVTLYQEPVICFIKVVSPLLHGHDNCEEFPIALVIVLFGRRAFSIVKNDWLYSSEPNILIKDAGNCEAAGIGLENYGLWRVETLQDQSIGKGLYKFPKC